MKTIEMFINEIRTNEALQMQLAEAMNTNTLADFLKAQGCDATAEEFISTLKAQSEEIDDEALDAVAGGISHNQLGEVLASIMTLGVACAVDAIISVATGAGVGDDPEGGLLCNEPGFGYDPEGK